MLRIHAELAKAVHPQKNARGSFWLADMPLWGVRGIIFPAEIYAGMSVKKRAEKIQTQNRFN